MSGKPTVLRERAWRDVDAVAEYYLLEVGPATARALIDALQDTFRQIGEHPAAGSSRHAHELDVPGLRFRTVGHFPCLVFFVEQAAVVDVWRILHGARDVAAWTREPRED